jgi:hypothetical protein
LYGDREDWALLSSFERGRSNESKICYTQLLGSRTSSCEHKKNISMTSANHEADDPILSRLSFAFFFFCVLLCGGFFIKVYFLLFRRRLSTAGDIAPGGIVIVMMCRDVAVVGS